MSGMAAEGAIAGGPWEARPKTASLGRARFAGSRSDTGGRLTDKPARSSLTSAKPVGSRVALSLFHAEPESSFGISRAPSPLEKARSIPKRTLAVLHSGLKPELQKTKKTTKETTKEKEKEKEKQQLARARARPSRCLCLAISL